MHTATSRNALAGRLTLAGIVMPEPPAPTLRKDRGESYGDWLARLRKLRAFDPWPAVFDKPRVAPLKIGVHEDLQARLNRELFTDQDVRAMLGQMCGRDGYVRALAMPESWRHDLDGHPVEPVTEDQREDARRRLNSRPPRTREHRAGVARSVA